MAVGYDMIMNTAPRENAKNFVPASTSQKAPHNSSLWARHGASFVNPLEKSYRELLKVHCIVRIIPEKKIDDIYNMLVY